MDQNEGGLVTGPLGGGKGDAVGPEANASRPIAMHRAERGAVGGSSGTGGTERADWSAHGQSRAHARAMKAGEALREPC